MNIYTYTHIYIYICVCTYIFINADNHNHEANLCFSWGKLKWAVAQHSQWDFWCNRVPVSALTLSSSRVWSLLNCHAFLGCVCEDIVSKEDSAAWLRTFTILGFQQFKKFARNFEILTQISKKFAKKPIRCVLQKVVRLVGWLGL